MPEDKVLEEKPVDKSTVLKEEEKPKEEEEVKKEEGMDMDEEEEESEGKKKKKKKEAKKGEGSSLSPAESVQVGNQDPHTITPNFAVPSQGQDIFVPQSQVSVSREQSTPMGKSVEPDLTKSPLFLNLSSQIDGIRDSVSKKVESLEKSVNDRLNNISKDMEKIEKFYNQSFYKAINENVAPEGTQAQSISKQISDGNVRFRQK